MNTANFIYRFCLFGAVNVLAGCFMTPLEPVHHSKIEKENLNAETTFGDDVTQEDPLVVTTENKMEEMKNSPEKNNQTFSLIKEKALEGGDSCDNGENESSMRILTKNEYLETIKVVFKLSDSLVQIERLLPPGSTEQGYNFLRDFNIMSTEKLEAFLKAGQFVSEKVVGENLISLDCGLSSEDCFRQWLVANLPVIWREAVSSADINDELEIFKSFGSDSEALKSMVHRFLMSPKFLYRSGLFISGSETLSNWEIVTFLSDSLWQGILNDELIKTANQIEALRKDQILALVESMLKSPDLLKGLDTLAKGWMDLKSKGESLTFPDTISESYSSDTFNQMISYFLFDRIEEGQDSLAGLLDSKELWLPSELAGLYKVSKSAEEKSSIDNSFERFEFSDERRGLLSQPGFLISASGLEHTNIPLRGKNILKNFMCHDLETPEDIVDVVSKVKFDHNKPVSTALNQITLNGTCESCHKLINGTGSVFEGLSPLGFPRALDDHGKNVISDIAVELPGGRDFQSGSVSDFTHELISDPSTGVCLTVKVFRMFNGRMEKEKDACRISGIYKKASDQNGVSLKKLIVELILSRSGHIK